MTYSKSGMKITTDIGLTVMYNGVYNVFVKVAKRYKGKLSGLCGNYNGKRNDEFRNPEDKLVPNALAFGNSWKTGEECPDVLTDNEHPCKNASPKAQKAKEQCSALKRQPFSKCNDVLDPDDGHIEECEYDVCICEENPKACLCESFSAYADECKDFGTEITWKNTAKFAKCSKYE